MQAVVPDQAAKYVGRPLVLHLLRIYTMQGIIPLSPPSTELTSAVDLEEIPQEYSIRDDGIKSVQSGRGLCVVDPTH